MGAYANQGIPVAVAKANGYSGRMALDPSDEDDGRNEPGEKEGRRRTFQDFDCPGCNANNPYDDAFGDGDEILCYYCGQQYKVRVDDEGRLRLKEV